MATVAIAASATLTVTACQAKPAAEIVGKQWQVTAIYDDAALPHDVPEGVDAPTITLGQITYTLADACGNESGALKWKGEAVELEAPEQDRATDCSVQAQTYAKRFREIIVGEFTYTRDDNGLRMREITAPEKASEYDENRGWTAVTSGYTEGR